MSRTQRPASISMVDPHPLCRLGLRALLARETGLVLLPDPCCVERNCDHPPPDVCVLDVDDEPASLETVRTRWPNAKIIALVDGPTHVNLEGITTISKRAPLPEMLDKIRSVARDHGFDPFPAADPLQTLSNREREIFSLILEGSSTESIAQRLGISVKTVETHRTHINRKLNAKSPADLVRFAAARGLLQ